MITKYLLKNSKNNVCVIEMAERRMLTAMSMLIMLSMTLLQTSAMVSFSRDYETRMIDVYTNRPAPFDGKGLHKPSDAFQPQELVTLYALVTFNNEPREGMLVGFSVQDPLKTTVVSRISLTNSDGIACIYFRIPQTSENGERAIFGEWHVEASVSIAGEIVWDTLTFQVGWIVQITDIRTLNFEYKPQIDFARGDRIIFNLKVKNIAFSLKHTIVTIDVQDAANYPILHKEEERLVQPGESSIDVALQIPLTATIGRATIFAAVYNIYQDGRIPFSPPVSSQFNIVRSLKKQYYLTIRTAPPGIVLISGEGWYDEGVHKTLSAPEYVYISSIERYKFDYWDVDGIPWAGNPTIVVMTKNHTATAHYIHQYYLSVKVEPAGIINIPGEGWYNKYVNVSLLAPDVSGYDFSHWDVDGETKGAGIRQISVYMDGPHTATAHYVVRAVGPLPTEWLYWVLALVLALVMIPPVVLVYRKLKRKVKTRREAFYRGWTAWYYGYNLREKSRSFKS